MNGVVKNVVRDRGFGFIKADGKEWFFHKDQFNGHWEDLCTDVNAKKQVSVEFDGRNSPKGPRAENVRRTDHPNEG